MSQRFDHVIVGSGINSLVAASLLSRGGSSVVVLEREGRLGGCMRAEELFPGYLHEVLSSWYPLFATSPAYEALGDDLHERGLELANSDTPTAVLAPDGSSLVLTTDAAENARRMNQISQGDGDRYSAAIGQFFEENSELVFSLLGNEPRSWQTIKALLRETRKKGAGDTLGFFGEALGTCRSWLERDIESDLVRALVAPWVLHAGLGPDDAYSGVMAKLIMGTVSLAGMPVVKGGSSNLVEAFRELITDYGGVTITGADVDSIDVQGGRAVSVTTTSGETYSADSAVIANVTPTQLYGRLLREPLVPAEIRADAENYRYGRSDMQIHFALNTLPEWGSVEIGEVPLVHLTSGLDGVSRAVNEAERGLLPAQPTVVVGQPTVLDPSRAPEGGAILWIQLQELPARIRGDARGVIEAPDGVWTEEVRERYADRIQSMLAAHIPNLEQSIVGRRVFSPADLESLNINLVGGDPYSGACTIDQFLAWRPLPGTKNHETPVRGLYHIGASTHPGPGLGGVSGYMVASKFL